MDWIWPRSAHSHQSLSAERKRWISILTSKGSFKTKKSRNVQQISKIAVLSLWNWDQKPCLGFLQRFKTSILSAKGYCLKEMAYKTPTIQDSAILNTASDEKKSQTQPCRINMVSQSLGSTTQKLRKKSGNCVMTGLSFYSRPMHAKSSTGPSRSLSVKYQTSQMMRYRSWKTFHSSFNRRQAGVSSRSAVFLLKGSSWTDWPSRFSILLSTSDITPNPTTRQSQTLYTSWWDTLQCLLTRTLLNLAKRSDWLL